VAHPRCRAWNIPNWRPGPAATSFMPYGRQSQIRHSRVNSFCVSDRKRKTQGVQGKRRFEETITIYSNFNCTNAPAYSWTNDRGQYDFIFNSGLAVTNAVFLFFLTAS
jgi:hypothetical protein